MEIQKYLRIISCVFIVGIFFILVGGYFGGLEHDKKEAADRALWVKASCPVFKSECGSSKHPYACEVKSPVVGRVEYRGVFVTAYSTC